MMRMRRTSGRLTAAALRRRRALACERFIAQRAIIGRRIGFDLCADPVWDMLLDLYSARLRGKRIGVTSLCLAAHVPPTTALRHIAILVERDYIIRSRDPDDARRILVQLTDKARLMLDRCLDALATLT